MTGVRKQPRLFYGWLVILITFGVLLVSAGIRSMPSILMTPLEEEFGWSRGSISGVVSTGIFLYGLMGPFSAAILSKYGVRRSVVAALALVGGSLAVTPYMTSLWQFQLLWGVASGLGTGMMANVLGVTVANRWFAERRGLIVGILTASAATGQLLFLPMLAQIIAASGWRTAVYAAVGAIAVILAVAAIWMRNHPYDVGAAPYGAVEAVKPEPFTGSILLTPLTTLRSAMGSKTFWLLAGTFFFCGFTTNGLIGTHLISACMDHGIEQVMAAGLLAMMGMFDLVGTTLSGWLTDRYDARRLLFMYYGLRGLSLLFLPYALEYSSIPLVVFSVFYGLDWIATVPPTVKLATQEFGRERAGMIVGWVVVAHQIGASAAAYGAGLVREWTGTYSIFFLLAGLTCLIASVMALRISKGHKTALQAGI
ncbi:MFS transporter [Gorillibacterium sp. sgz5001074]|uniref:MFS transporter n=1 Tax=Gorillibacterium sp. sgz5001074 TaxID=3446695 RepID=UPI003F667386